MRVVPITWVLRVHTRPYCSGVERELHSRNQEVVVAAILDVVEASMMNYLAYYFFYSPSNPI